MGLNLPLLSKLQLKSGDELHFTGSPTDLNRVQSKIGYKITAAAVTDFVFFGIGMLIGMLIGLIQFGSQVDLGVPKGAEVLVKVGDVVVGGETVLVRYPLRRPAVRRSAAGRRPQR